MRTLVRRIRILLLIFAAASCGSKPGPGPDPVIEPPPQISCPATITLQILGGSLALNYPAPSVSDGTPPVAVACLPVSGSAFPVGETIVSCSATDARTRRADCSFRVNLTSGTIGATRYFAFGDSVTHGIDGFESVRRRRLMAITPSQSYPSVLQALLRRDYPTQEIVVQNHGVDGVRLTTDSGSINRDELDRLDRGIDGFRPHAVLLLMGYNDLGSQTPQVVRDSLHEFVKLARNKGVPHVFLSNLTPPGLTGERRLNAAAVVQTNSYIAQIAAVDGAILVNAYDAFIGREDQLISDGLHPTVAGYEVLAQTFYDAIKRTVGTDPPSSAAAASSKLISPRR